MQAVPEIILPPTKPESEWVRGRALQKVSPTYRHARLQILLATALGKWAEGRGRVGTEWRFRVNPPGEAIRPLVPDVAYLSYDRVPLADDHAAQVPLGTPDIAIEILSPDDRKPDVRDKVATYLAAGSLLVMVVHPEQEQIVAIDRRTLKRFKRGDAFKHWSAPGFELDVSWLFDAALR